MSAGQLLKRILHIKFIILLVLLILVASLVAALHLLMATLPAQKGQLESLLSVDGYRTQISRVEGRWHNLLPIVEMQGVRVTNAAGDEVAAVARAELEFSVTHSLLQWNWVFDSILLEDLQLGLVVDDQGRWRLEGTPASDPVPELPDTSVTPYWLSLLAVQRNIELRDTRLGLSMASGEQLPEQQLNLIYQRRFSGYRLSAQLEAQARDAAKLILHGEALPGDEDFSGDFYLHLPQLETAQWEPLLQLYVPTISNARLQADIWGHWQDQQLLSVRGKVELPTLQLATSESSASAPLLSAFKADFQLAPWLSRIEADDNSVARQWQLQLANLAGQWQGQTLPLNQLNIRAGGSGPAVLSTGELDLAQFNRSLVNASWLPEKARTQLERRSPAGLLRNINVAVADIAALLQGPIADADMQLTADLEEVSIQQWDGAPTVAGINGRIRAGLDGGRIDLDSEALMLDFPKLFSQGWQFQRAQGVLHWWLREDGLKLRSEHMQVAMVDSGIAADGRFALDVPWAGKQESELTLLLGMRNSDAGQPALFMPDKELDPELYQWVKGAVQSARLQRGAFLYHGGLESSAPDPSIQLYLDVADASMRYQPDWPPVDQVHGQVLVKGEALLVTLQQGRTFNTQIQPGTRITLMAGSDILQVDGQLKGPAADIRSILLQSPIAETLGSEFAQWTLTGEAATTLDLDLNLGNMDNSGIAINSMLNKGVYQSEALDLAFQDINGGIGYYHDKGLVSEGLTARFMEQPIKVTIESEQRSEGLHTLVNAKGRVAVKRLNQWLKQPLLEPVSGETAYQAQLDLCTYRTDCTRLNISSDLQGVSADHLPQPFAKTAEQSVPLVVRNQWQNEQHWLRLTYGDQLHTLLLLQDDSLQGGEVVVGAGQPPPVVRNQGLYIRGALPLVDVEQWQALVADEGRDPQELLSKGGRVMIDPLLRNVDLSFGTLKMGEYAIEDLHLSMTPANEYWRVNLEAPVVQGYVDLPQREKLPYRIVLSRLYLPAAGSDEATADAAQQPDPLTDYDPRQLPAVVIDIDDLRRGDSNFGAWAFTAEPTADGMKVSDIDGQFHKIEVSAVLDWVMTAQGAKTRIDYRLQANDLAAVQKDWGSEVVVEGRDGLLTGNLSWPGSPLNFALAQLDGYAKFKASKGRLLEAGSAGGIMKLFGILNFKTLARRLRLDFSDLSKGGYSFDTMAGSYNLNQGQAVSDEPLRIEGPSAAMRLEGRFNLVEQTLNNRLDVALPMAENLSLGAVLLGTPYVAGAVYLFDKLMGSPLSDVATASYRVSGSWENPVVEPLNGKTPQVPVKKP